MKYHRSSQFSENSRKYNPSLFMRKEQRKRSISFTSAYVILIITYFFRFYTTKAPLASPIMSTKSIVPVPQARDTHNARVSSYVSAEAGAAGGGEGARAAARAAAWRRAFRRRSAMEDERQRAASAASPAYGGHSAAAAAAAAALAYCSNKQNLYDAQK